MSAGNPNTIVVLGPTPESYYVGYGRRHFVENMSPSFTNHAKTALNITMSRWIRFGFHCLRSDDFRR